MSKASDLLNQLASLGIEIQLDDNNDLILKGEHHLLSDDLLNQVRERKPELVEHLLQQQKSTEQVTHNISDALHLDNSQHLTPSFAQQRLWLLDKIDGGGTHYNISSKVKLFGKLNKEALQKAFKTILIRHESLRTCFNVDEEGEPYQVIQSADLFEMGFSDLSYALHDDTMVDTRKAQNEEKLTLIEDSVLNVGFDLSQDLMLRVHLVKVNTNEHILLICMHHIASDGWSVGILSSELSQLYQAFCQHHSDPLPPLSIQYANYAHWQRKTLTNKVLNQQLIWWQEQLKNLPDIHSLPIDYPRPSTQSFLGASVEKLIGLDTYNQLKQVCIDANSTLFMGVYAVFSVLLARYSNETNIVIGTPIANREQPEISGLIGFFVNNLVLRCDLSDNPDFIQLLHRCKTSLLETYAQQQMPFEKLVEHLQPNRSLSHHPLFQIMLAFQNLDLGSLELPGLTNELAEQESTITKYDLTLEVIESDTGLYLNWEYNRELFASSTIEQMANDFSVLLHSMVFSPEQKVLNAQLCSHTIQQHLLVAESKANNLLPLPCIQQLFEQQVTLHPDYIALDHQGTLLTYDELNTQANRLAHYLINHCQLKPDTLIGLCMEPDPQLLVGILGILKAGGAYVPLDPAYPEERLSFIVADASLKTIITHRKFQSEFSYIPSIICLDDTSIKQKLFECRTDNISPQTIGLTPNHLAYVIYTSGSTGKPKGVLIEHENVTRLFDASSFGFSFGPDDIWTLFHSYAFDFSVWEIWGALIHGGRLIIIPRSVARSSDDFYQLVSDKKVTILNQTPGAFIPFISEDIRQAEVLSLRYVIFGGEALNLGALVPWVSKHGDNSPQLINMYGITETTVHVTYRRVLTEDILKNKASFIGKPLTDLSCYVLSPQMQLVPPGVSGELYVGGAGLARGYLNRPHLNTERFITHSFANKPHQERLYKTGDLVRFKAGGELEYIGRNDKQVKLRGFRIELGEIENTLLKLELVENAAVQINKNVIGDTLLVAYVVVHAQSNMQSEQARIDLLRRQISKHLPDYMIPSFFIFLDELPLTRNGKVNYQALPQPSATLNQSLYQAPETDTEKQLCDIWQTILGIDRVGITDDFFELGGHSLLVIQVVTQAQKRGIKFNARQVFSTPTIAGLAAKTIETSGALSESDSDFQTPANLIPDNCQHLTPQMLPLVSLLEEDLSQIIAMSGGNVSNIQDIYPLTALQEGILFHHMVNDSNDPYVVPMLFSVENKSQLDKFIDAIKFVVERHDVFRTCILWENLPEPVQLVYRHVEVDIDRISLSADTDALSQMMTLCQPEYQRLDLKKAPLLRVQIAQSPDKQEYYLLLQIHHIIDDATSLRHLYREISLFISGNANTLGTPIPYREFVAHSRYLSEQNDAWAFFTELLADVEVPTLPFELSNIQVSGQSICETKFELSHAVSNQLRSVAKTLKVTPAILFHASWAMVVASCSNSKDVLFGTVLSGRLQEGLDKGSMLGLFINTLPLRVKLENCSVIDLITQIQHSLNELISYEHASLALIQQCSAIPAGMPLFSAIFNFRHFIPNNEEQGDSSNGITLVEAKERTNYPFSLNIDDLGHGFALDIQVSSPANPDRVADYVNTALVQLLDCLSNNPEQRVDEISVLSQQELAQQLSGFSTDNNKLEIPFPKDQCLHQLVEIQTEKHPDKIAIAHDSQYLSYKELNDQANQLAHYLIESGDVRPGALVGICMERSFNMVVGILAVLKAGAAYLPLDPAYPQARLDYILNDSENVHLLTQTSIAQNYAFEQYKTCCLDDESIVSQLRGYSKENPHPDALGLTPENLAYSIYTSGSTGEPKGSIISHYSAVNLNHWYGNTYDFNHADQTLILSAIGFDLTQKNIFTTLIQGGTLVFPSMTRFDLDKVLSACNRENVTNLNCTPSVFNLLIEDPENWSYLNKLRWVFLGGEPIETDKLTAWLNSDSCNASIINMYGPTECTDITTVYQVTGREKVIPIGRPIQNVNAFVLNTNMQPVPFGVSGELFIGGVSVTPGYINRPELTQQKFVSNPFSNKPNDKLYRTGDVVKWVWDSAAQQANLEFVARIDQQTKIRGFRVEPGEIEQCINREDFVNTSLVIVRGESSEDKQLIGFIQLSDESASKKQQALHIEKLKSSLYEQLPEYMIPAAFVLIKQWPLTPNGKIDKSTLLNSDIQLTQEGYVAPANKTEKVLVAIWAKLLKLNAKELSATSSFFSLGGHSLLLVRMVSEIRKNFDKEIPLKTIFDTSTIQSLALIVDACNTSIVREPIHPATRTEALIPVSYSQQRLWFIDRLMGKSPEYNIPFFSRVTGDFDVNTAKLAFRHIIKRHEILRTTYEENEQGVFQQIHSDFDFNVQLIDLSHLNGDTQNSKLTELIDTEALKTFDLTNDLMLRATFITLSEKNTDKNQTAKGVLLLNMHHIASDGWSTNILLHEFVICYKNLKHNLPIELPDLPIQYADFSLWQRDGSQQEALEEQLQYWDAHLADVPPIHSVETDFPRPEVKQHQGGIQSGFLNTEVTAALLEVASAYNLTPFMVLHAALALVLSRHSNTTDIVIGTPVANRLQTETDSLIGFFVNTLVLRTNTAQANIQDYFTHIRQVNIQAQANQEVPFDFIVERCNVPRSLQYTPLAQIMLSVNVDPVLTPEIEGLSICAVESEQIVSKFDIQLDGQFNDDGLILTWNYDASLFAPERIQQFSRHIECLLTQISTLKDATTDIGTNITNNTEHPIPLSRISILSAEEIIHLTEDINTGKQTFANDVLIHQKIEHWEQMAPDAVALAFDDQEVSYSQLNVQANRLANLLIDDGVVKGDLVGVCLDRSIEMVTSLLAVLKAGAAYVPLDPKYPANRLEYLIQDAKLKAVITKREIRQSLPNHQFHAICLDNDDSLKRLEQSSDSNPNIPGLTVNDLAYVIYTSGSTGQPKGVLVEHHNVCRLFDATANEFNFNPSDVWTLFHSFAFDFSVWEIWGALCHGCRLVIVPHWISRSTSDFYDLVVQRKVTVLNQTPGAFAQFIAIDEQMKSGLHLRFVIFGGESLSLSMLKPWFDKHRNGGEDNQPALINMYGITETTVHVTYRKITREDLLFEQQLSLIGKPIDDLSAFILAPDGSLAPYGAPGELHISGAGLARGYLHQPELTAKKFIHNPYSANPNDCSLMYKTGDLAKYRPNGELEYLGRIDDQVKVRGFRIETGEVEACIRKFSGVQQTTVIAVDKPARLVAYIVPEPDINLKTDMLIDQLKEHMASILPGHMMPSLFTTLTHIPLTAHGKVDRKMLPAPSISHQELRDIILPSSALERQICAIWQQLLGIDKISINDNFFNIGGDSIRALQVAVVAKKQGIPLNVKDIYTLQNVNEIASSIEKSGLLSEQLTGAPPLHLIAEEFTKLIDGSPYFSTEIEDCYPVTSVQQTMLEMAEHEHQQAGRSVYHTQTLFQLTTDDFHPESMEYSVNFLLRKHPTLRTRFERQENGRFLQFVMAEFQLNIPVTDLSSHSEQNQVEAVKSFIDDDLQKPFVPSLESPMLRLQLFKHNEQSWSVFIAMHHAIEDGWGFIELMRELFTLYANHAQNRTLPVLNNNPVNVFKEHLALELEAAQSTSYQSAWAQLLDAYQPMPAIEGAATSPIDNEENTNNREFRLNKAQINQLMQFSQQHDVQVKTLFLLVFKCTLSRLLESSNITVDVVTSARSDRLTDPTNAFGLFWNFCPVNSELGQDWEAKLLPLSRDLTQKLQKVDTYALYPKSAILQDINPNVATDAAFNYTSFHNNLVKDEFDQIKVDLLHTLDQFHHKIKLFVSNNPAEEYVVGQLEFAPGYFNKQQKDQLMTEYQGNLEKVINSQTSRTS